MSLAGSAFQQVRERQLRPDLYRGKGPEKPFGAASGKCLGTRAFKVLCNHRASRTPRPAGGKGIAKPQHIDRDGLPMIQHDAGMPSRCQDSVNLGDCRHDVRCVVQHAPREHDIECGVSERQTLRIRLHQTWCEPVIDKPAVRVSECAAGEVDSGQERGTPARELEMVRPHADPDLEDRSSFGVLELREGWQVGLEFVSRASLGGQLLTRRSSFRVHFAAGLPLPIVADVFLRHASAVYQSDSRRLGGCR